MEIRKIKLPKDINPLLEVSLAAFQYPENPEWSINQEETESLKDQVTGIKRYWPLLRVGMLFSKTLRHLFEGYVCEENGKMIGTIIFQLRPGKNPVFYISNVGVHPDYRRRGIARKLVEEALAEMRTRGDSVVLLDVIDGNLPAYHLYESLGWEHYSGVTNLMLDSNRTIVQPVPDKNYEIIDIPLSDWKTCYEFMDRITPDNVRKFVPVTPSEYKGSRILDFLQTLIGERQGKVNLRNKESGDVIGLVNYSYRTRKGGANRAHIFVDREFGSVFPFLVDWMSNTLQKLAPGRSIELMLQSWQPELIHCALDRGYTQRLEYHRMGLLIRH